MRLINVKTLKLEEVHGDNVPPYAILSHTWATDNSEELMYDDLEKGKTDKPGLGSAKLWGCCRQAAEDGIDYVWIDTCCINKTDPTDLGEAINSMFRWYEGSKICYAYLSDVPEGDVPHKLDSKFRSSRWFSRGWTLQELLAPSTVRFYNAEWRPLGNKGSLGGVIEKVAKIPRVFLLGEEHIAALHHASVAQRMSWAAHRVTKRKEDLVYCLLGIFRVAMPLIYGEGLEGAFFRLQEQIMRTTRDDSIFAWRLDPDGSHEGHYTLPGTVLARCPTDFAASGHIVAGKQNAMTSPVIHGGALQVNMSIVETQTCKLGVLHCGPENDREGRVVGIPLAAEGSDEYFRPDGSHSVLVEKAATRLPARQIHITNVARTGLHTQSTQQQHWFAIDGYAELDLDLVDVHPPSSWDKDRSLVKSCVTNGLGFTPPTFVRLRHPGSLKDFVIALEVKSNRLRQILRRPPLPNPYILVSRKDVSLADIVETFRYMPRDIPKLDKARIATLVLTLTCEPVSSSPMYVVKLDRARKRTIERRSIDIGAEVMNLKLRLEQMHILEKSARVDGIRAEAERLRTMLAGRKQQIKELYDEISQIEAKIRLEAQKVVEDEQRLDELDRLGTKMLSEKKKAEHESASLGISWTTAFSTGGDRHRPWRDGSDPWSLLIWAIEVGHEDMLRRALGLGTIDINQAHSPECAGMLDTPLVFAARKGWEPAISILLDHGANTEAQPGAESALYAAASHVHMTVVKLLLDRGAAIDPTALHVFIRNRNGDAVKFLLDRGADREAVASDGETPTSLARKLRFYEIRALLGDNERLLLSVP